MKTSRNNLSSSKIELSVIVSTEEMLEYSKQAALKLSEKTTIEGFRPGKAPYETVKTRLGEMAILDEASHIAISKTIDKALKESVTEDWVGQPQITIVKLAPENDFEYKALITLLPELTLGEYKNLGIKRDKIEVKDDEIEKVINHLRETRVKEVLAIRSAEKGDKVILDINLSIDNVPLENGQGKDVAVILGNEYIVPGFDEKIVGAKKDDKLSFVLHYPKEHYQKQLADKKVSFEVLVKDVFSRELPEVNDDFVAGFGLKTPEELKKNIKESLEHEKKHEAEHKLEQEVLKAVIKNCKINEIADSLIEGELDMMMDELKHNVEASGGRFADYLASINKTIEALRQELRERALERVQASLVLRSLIKEEKISVEAKAIDNELDNLKKQYSHDPKSLEVLNLPAYRKQIEMVLLNREIIAKLISWNT